MSATLSCPALIELLRQHALLEPPQLDELTRLTDTASTPQTLGKLILDRDWLTSFQVNRILVGREEELFLGQYLLQAKLGEGGMGQVFRALDRTMGRAVALKLIRPDVLNSQQAVERFNKEIRAAAGLDHPNIIRAYHAGCLGNAHFLVMEYAEGTDLYRRVQQGHPLPVASVCDWCRQTALALQHVGELGMVHRDVKPMNLLLTVKGVVKLLDMGLARKHSLAQPADSDHATRQGSMMGTPDYVAPEQIVDASSVDIRADIYSLGCTLHHLLTGSPPFPGNDLRDKLRRQLGEQPEPLERLRPDVPVELAALVRWMMRKEPHERPQTPAEVAAALTKFVCVAESGNSLTASIPPSVAHLLAETTDFVKPTAAGRRKRWLIAGGIVAAVLVLLALWNPFAGTDRIEDPQPKPDAGGEQARNDKKPLPEDPPRPKDGPRPKDPPEQKDLPDEPRKILPVPLPQRNPPPWKERLPWQPAELVQVIGDERGRHWAPVSLVVWSGDGRRLASSGDDGIRIWEAATLREVGVLNLNIRATAMALSPDGKRLITVSYSDEGMIWDLAGAPPRKDGVLKMAGTLRGNPLTALAFSQDGKTLTALTARGGMVRWQAKRLDVPPDEVIPPEKSFDERIQSLNRNGTRLARLSRELNRTAVFLRSVGETAEKERTADDNILGQGRSLALSPDGRILALTVGPDHKETSQSASKLRMWKVDRDEASECGQYIRGAGGMGLLTFSEDGKWLAGAAGANILVWRISEKGPSDPLELKGHAALLTSLAFSPSGTVLASASNDGSVRLWDVSQPPPKQDSAGWKVFGLAFSPDGKRLATVLRTLATRTSLDVNSRIRVQSLDLPESTREAEFEGFLHSVAFSPDDARLVACGTASRHRKTKQHRWGVMEARDAKTLEISNEEGFEEDVFQAQFHDNGKLCTFLTIHAYRSAGSRVVFRQFDTATWKELGNGPRSTAFGTVSPDGKLGMTRETGNEPGVGKTDEAVLWDLSQLAKDAMPEKKRLTLGVSYPSWDLLQAFSPDGSRLAVVGTAWQVDLWDHVKGRRLGSNKSSFGKVSALLFSPDGALLATIEDEKRVAVWRTDGEGLKAHREPWIFPGTIHAYTFDPSGHFLALATANGTVYLLRVRDAAP